MAKFGFDQIGCHADDAFGHGHLREVLAALVDFCDGPDALRESLESDAPDDFSDEDEALEFLADFTHPGLFWEIDGGLFLREHGPDEFEREAALERATADFIEG